MKEALELIGYLKDYHMNAVPYYNWLDEIEKYILKAQEQEKALDEIQTIMDNWLINGQYESNYALEKIDNVLEKYNI